MRIYLNKKGEDLIRSVIVFIVLNLIFFTSLFLFVKKTVSLESFYEEVYAKKIGLILDRAEKGMVISIDVSPLIEIAKKNKMSLEEIKSNMITIDEENSEVIVKLRKESGFKYKFFSKINLDEKTSKIQLNENEGGKLFLVFDE
ncbi:MAG: hypothetical protein QW273_02605 [Candidatus Pacearchaeota archaeon]